MTTESETPPTTGQDRILLRQANPLVVKNGKAQKGLFRIDTDSETGERAISVELARPEYSAQDAYERRYGGHPLTIGTVGISMDEIDQLNLQARPDPLPDNSHHWLLVLPEGASNSSVQNRSRPSPSAEAGCTRHRELRHCGSRRQRSSAQNARIEHDAALQRLTTATEILSGVHRRFLDNGLKPGRVYIQLPMGDASRP